MKTKILLMAVMASILLSACGANVQASQPVAETPVATVQPGAEYTPEPIEAAVEQTDHVSFFEKTKAYILTGQEDLPEAEKLHWSKAFLDAVDFEDSYQSYLKTDGAVEDEKIFAAYITGQAVPPENWKTLFEQDLSDAYGQTPASYEDLGNNVYQVYVDIDGQPAPFVAVNAGTGWYHG